jgi:hypothetical protein
VSLADVEQIKGRLLVSEFHVTEHPAPQYASASVVGVEAVVQYGAWIDDRQETMARVR